MSAANDDRRDRDGTPAGEPGGGDAPPRTPHTPDLRAAMRTARVDDAERSRAIADLQGIELARLEVLQARLVPVLAQVPEGVDLFDAALMPVPRPRLFIDMIGFVEMASDRRRYRLVQDRAEGRTTLCESERVEVIADAVTAYIARRLIEREKALASAGTARPGPPAAGPALPQGALARAGRIVLEYLGLAALVVLFWVFGQALYHWIRAHH